MKYILDTVQAKEIDRLSITQYGIPSVVLMERAALAVAEFIIKYNKNRSNKTLKILCACGKGNNGADGMAAARILHEKGFDVTVLTAGDQRNSSRGTDEYELQKSIAIKLGMDIRSKVEFNEYNLIVDAIFGIGLTRDVEGIYARLVENINKCEKAVVVAVDIPSGVNADNGHILGCAVKADVTVTFGYCKIGLVLYPGADYAGTVKVCDIGLPLIAFNKVKKKAFTFTKKDIQLIPRRKKNSNKGTFGKVLVVAGSKNMGGAACLTGLSSYRSGTGLVKIVTHEENRSAVLKMVPEAVISTYKDADDDIIMMLDKELSQSKCVILGPGLSTEEQAVKITEHVLSETKCPMIVDADALNIVSQKNNTAGFSGENMIITPHIGEMSRLTGKSIAAVKADAIRTAKNYAKRNKLVCVLKDARTIVTDGTRVYINTSGNSGMATGGSGDVLAGIISGLISNGMTNFDAATMGVFIHGCAGDAAAEKYGEYGMKAGDIIESICKVF